MTRTLIAYVTTVIPFLALDFVWLNFASGAIYRPRLGALLLDQPNLGIAAGFYLLYAAAVVLLVVVPALDRGTWTSALLLGGVFGLAAYGTYDMTNLATLRGWSAMVSAVDMAWGMTVTAISATCGFFLTRLVHGP